MENIKRFIASVEHILNTKKKRHIIAGILFSTSIFCGGLALTVMSTRIEENEHDE